ncbi:unnamed protein product [Spirodela intermedia]|uniref:F-box/LRR-repeat protein 15-like leucin rich repeat domain-containing protein n=1 Tax=Spirodela intermedia TaxID=51605 RepID=A0A7I8ID32_SPIIN|nr:unnamed protein product [Spirodela intermedia]CAA6655727.1 unnamed protein product [Spirodela intermedia]
MATSGDRGKWAAASPRVCINEVLTDDELRAVLWKLQTEEERDGFGLVCKRWLQLQSSERRRLRARAGPAMLRRMAERFSGVVEMDLSQSTSRSFYPGLTDSDLSVVAARFWRLVSLDLKNCKGISDAGIIALGNGLPSLQVLDVSGCRKLTDTGLIVVSQSCSKLRGLHLSGCKLVTDGLLQALSRNCPELEDLGLSGCHNITDSGLSTLVNGCRRLRFLDLSKCSKVGDEGVSQIARSSSSSLKTLKLLDCLNVSDLSIYALANSCENLETIVLGGCRNVSEESVKALMAACSSSIKNLRVDWCLDVGDSSVRCVLSRCRNLAALDISCCDKVTDAAFHELGAAEFESGLKVFKASSCPRITVAGLGMLLEFCKFLEYVDVSSCPHITKAGCEQAG